YRKSDSMTRPELSFLFRILAHGLAACKPGETNFHAKLPCPRHPFRGSAASMHLLSASCCNRVCDRVTAVILSLRSWLHLIFPVSPPQTSRHTPISHASIFCALSLAAFPALHQAPPCITRSMHPAASRNHRLLFPHFSHAGSNTGCRARCPFSPSLISM